jgi:FecR protein
MKIQEQEMNCLCAISRAFAFLLCMLLCSGNSWAEAVGVVTNLSGTLAVLKPDGTTRILSLQSSVESGDTLSTQKNTFARIKFTDGGEVILRPDSVFKVDSYGFKQEQPQEDSFVTSLLKGGARLASGLIGKRGNRDAYNVKTATATIGIRGTDYAVLTCQGDCLNLKNGTYTDTYEGIISLTNPYGTLDCTMGQSCYAAPDAAPVVLPETPDGVDFVLPPMFLVRIGADVVLDAAGHKECVLRAGNQVF